MRCHEGLPLFLFIEWSPARLNHDVDEKAASFASIFCPSGFLSVEAVRHPEVPLTASGVIGMVCCNVGRR
jgi:hypothetical protein